MKFLGAVLGIFLISICSAQAWTKTPYHLQIPPEEARTTLNAMLENLRLNSNAWGNSTESVTRLIRAFRFAPVVPNALTIKEAPFLGMMIHEKIGDLYREEYDKAWEKQYQENVINISLETLFDTFMKAIIDKKLPDLDGVREAAEEIGECLAQHALAGKEPDCVLDNSPKIEPRNKLDEARVKALCPITVIPANPTLPPVLIPPMMSNCYTRKIIFNAAKEKLIAIRKNAAFIKAAGEKFAEIFPEAFRKRFLLDIAQRVSTFSHLVSDKFKGEVSEYWELPASLIELEERKVKLSSFIAGLRADLWTSALLTLSQDSQERGLAALLFYAVANRLLLFTGGTEASWDGIQFKLADHSPVDLKNPKNSPPLATNIFGGWGLEIGQGQGSYSPWRWESYATSADSFRLIPTELSVNERGMPILVPELDPTESLENLSDFLLALTDFLEATGSSGALSQFFGSAQENENEFLKKLLNPENPALFPRQGRKLAVGMIVGIIKNLVTPKLGHLELAQPGTPGIWLGLTFFDRIHLSGRENAKASAQGVGKLITALASLRKILEKDSDFPKELVDKIPELDSLILTGAQWLGTEWQESDGGFRGDSVHSKRELKTQVIAIHALKHAYDASRVLILRLRLKQSFVFLNQFWQEGPIPTSEPSLLWALLNLWDEVRSSSLYKDLAKEIDWSLWEKRFELIRQKMMDQLKTDQGPNFANASFTHGVLSSPFSVMGEFSFGSCARARSFCNS